MNKSSLKNTKSYQDFCHSLFNKK